MDRETAAELLAGSFYQRGVVEGIDNFNSALHDSTLTGVEWESLRAFHSNLTLEQKAVMDFAIREAVRGAVLRLCIFFDGAAGYEYQEDSPDNPFEYTIGLRQYQDEDAEIVTPGSEIPICPTERGADVHDILLAIFDTTDAPT